MLMKTNILLSSLFLAGIALTSCGNSGSDNGTKFNPKEKESTMSAEERKAAIEAKKQSLNVDVNSLMNADGVKLTVLPPVPSGDITEAISERIGMKMLGVIAANGIGGVNNVPGFALGASVSESGRQTTGSAPQKYILKYDITYQVLNVADGSVYGTASETITGVGNSFEQAAANAVDEIKSTDALQSMLASSSDKIITWYRENLPTLKSQVETAKADNDYALALAYLNSVPSQATEAYAYAQKELPGVANKFKAQNTTREFVALKSAIAAGEQSTELNADVYTHLAMLPSDSPEYAQGTKLVEAYEKTVLAKQAAAEQREIAAEEARQHHEQQMQMAQLEAEKAMAISQAKATEQSMMAPNKDFRYVERGFWGKLGARIINGIDAAADKISDNK